MFFLKNPDSVRERFCGLWMCKHKLEQTPFCICHNLNPNTLSSSKLLPSKQRSTIFFFVYGCANASLNKFPFALAKTQSRHTFIVTAATHKQRMCLQKQNCTNCVFRAVHAWYSARPQNAVNTMGLAFFGQLTENVNILSFIGVFSSLFGRINCIYSVLWPCAVACAVRALCKTLQNTMFVPP